MTDFDNFFDEAMSRADDAILSVMGAEARITSGLLSGKTVAGVFDNPESVAYPVSGVRIEGVSPLFFVKTAEIAGLQRPDRLEINGTTYWVDRVGPDDCGTCHIHLGTGIPPASNRRR